MESTFSRITLAMLVVIAWTVFVVVRLASDGTNIEIISSGLMPKIMTASVARANPCRIGSDEESSEDGGAVDLCPESTADGKESLMVPHPVWKNPSEDDESSFVPPVRSIRRIFTCGIVAWLIPASQLIFTEYYPDRLYVFHAIKCPVDRVMIRARESNIPLVDSLLIVRPTIGGMGFVGVGNETDFPGKILYVNTENDAFPIPSGQFGLGPYDDTNHTMRLYLASLYLNTLHDDMKSLILSPGTAHKPKNTKRHFALFVASHHCTEFRLNAVIELSRIDVVHVAGKCVRPLRERCQVVGCRVGPDERIVPVTVTRRPFDRITENIHDLWNQSFWTLHEYYREYRFAMVFENSKFDGYVTEKIVNAFLGGSVPIYFGTKDVFTIFNRRAMIYWDKESIGDAMDSIRRLEEDEGAYDEVLMNEPILANGAQTVEDVFSLNVSHGGGKLRERIRRMVFGLR